MITIIFGSIRVGKTALMTYLSTRLALDPSKAARRARKIAEYKARGFHFADGSALYADYDISVDLKHGRGVVQSKVIDPLQLGDSVFIKPHSVLAVQEAQTYYSSTGWQRFRAHQAKYFQTSGHYGIDIFLDCQSTNNIVPDIRSIATFIEVLEGTAYDAAGRPSENVTRKDFSRVVWLIKRYQTERDVIAGRGVKDKIVTDLNVYAAYDPYSRADDYLPPDPKITII